MSHSHPVHPISHTKIGIATSYAALLLHDCGLPLTHANISKLLTTAHFTHADAGAATFARVLADVSITNFIGSVGSSSAPAAVAAVTAPAAAAKSAPVPVKEERNSLIFIIHSFIFPTFLASYLTKKCKVLKDYNKSIICLIREVVWKI